MAAAAVAARAATESIPPPHISVDLAGSVRIPGGPPKLAWPASGEAALLTPGGAALGSAQASKAVPIASVTKVMTAYLVLKDHPLATGSPGFNLTITAAEAAELPARRAQDQSLVDVHAGQVLTERAALEALLLPSADNIADALAAYDAGSIPAFVARMNLQAAAFGMAHTHFADASGLDPHTVSSARDLVLLGQKAMAVPAFASIVAMPSVTVPGLGVLENYNTLVGTDGFDGVKTGSTLAAGQALMFSVSRPVAGHRVQLLGAVLEQHGPGVAGGALQAARALTDSYYKQLQVRTALPAGTAVAAVSRVGHRSTLTTLQPLRLVALPGATVELAVTVHSAPGQRWATVRVGGYPAGAQVSTGVWAVPGAGVGWRLNHLL